MNAVTTQVNGDRLVRLWGDIDIPIIVGTGPFGSGKTLFGASIAPGPETLVMDQEGSSLTYRSIGFDHIDMAIELTKLHPDGFTPIQRWEWFKKEAIARGKSGRYRVLMVDPTSEIEDGLEAYVRANLPKYGLSSDQVRKASGLLWGVMKREWKLFLDMLRAYYQTIYLTVHLRNEYLGNTPTGKKEPKGKETLFELASLFLWFDRSPDKSGKVSAKPSANILKSRLAVTKFVDGELVTLPVLPPHLEVATPSAIRQYIANPPDYAKLKKSELVIEQEMSDAEKLRLESQIAADKREAAQAELTRLELMSQAAEKSRALTELQAAQSASPDNASAVAAANAAKSKASADHDNAIISAIDLDSIVKSLSEAFETPEECKAAMPDILAKAGVKKLSELTNLQALGVQGELADRIFKRREVVRKAETERLNREKPAEDPNIIPFTPNKPVPGELQEMQEFFGGEEKPVEKPVENSGPIDKETIDKIVVTLNDAFATQEEVRAAMPDILNRCGGGAKKVSELKQDQGDAVLLELADLAIARRAAIERLKDLAAQTNWEPQAQSEWLKKRGLGGFRGCTMEQLGERIGELEKTAASFQGGAPKN